MWSTCSAEAPSPTTSHSMWMLSPMGGLFDSDVFKHQQPDLLDIDPDLLSTLDLPMDSPDSNEDTNENNIMDNWQMNEVFQDISLNLLDSADCLHSSLRSSAVDTSLRSPAEDENLKDMLDQVLADQPDIVNQLFGDQSIDSLELIQQPLGSSEVTQPAQLDGDGVTVCFDLAAAVKEAFGTEAALAGYSLLEELESSESSPADETVVEMDHQYTQTLKTVEVKPHETKKQAIRRVKNNAASKVCRKQRKNKFTANIAKVEELTKVNSELKQKITSVQNVVNILREHLVMSTTKK